jgi:hypothetical protein
MIDVLKSELNEMGQRKQFVQDAVIDVDDSIKKMLGDLRVHIETQVQAIKEITIKEEDLLEKLLKEDRGNLNELKKLGDLKSGLGLVQQEGKIQNEKLEKLIELLSKKEKKGFDNFDFLKNENLPQTIGFALGGIAIFVVFVFLLVKFLNLLFS